ncbi:MAG: GNAT family N-acetyltransferase [Actinomycetota bacterium]|nr:GNAT family N-acetyltransferase [Actinomycetota bacterium]
MSDLRRALDFMTWVENRCATRIEPWRWGEVVFNDDFPRVYDFNFLRIDGVPDDFDFTELMDQAFRLHTAAGHKHRKVVVEDEAMGRSLQTRFGSGGWDAAELLVMIYRGAGSAGPQGKRGAGSAGPQGKRGNQMSPPADDRVRELSLSELRELRSASFASGPIAHDPEAFRQLLDKDAVYLEAGNARYIAALVEGRAVCSADLYSDGATAQIEAVLTLEPFRKRGLATAVVKAAVATALAEGHDFVFLIADAGDWPKDMYARMGFQPVGICWDFTKSPG